jgi:phage tail-like protein
VYYFAVEIDGVQEAFFRSCSGLKTEAEVVTVQEGGLNTMEHKLIGRSKYPNIVLKQGFATSHLWEKRLSFMNDDPGKALERFNGTIIQFGPGGKRAHSWQFSKAWVCKWEGPEFDATKNEISIESIEIAHEGLSYKAGK